MAVKKLIMLMLAFMLALCMAACGTSEQGQDASQKDGDSTPVQGEEAGHTIAVLVYDRADEEVLSFKHYLEDYIADAFDVKFLYSDSISSQEDAMEFLKNAADYGAEGVMSFNSYDLAKEVDFCADKGMYFMMASGTVTEKAFDAVSDNKYFLGVIGPGDEMEYTSGANLANAGLTFRDGKKAFFVLSGGSAAGNEMHRLRTVGLLERLESAYGVKLDRSPEEIAASEDIFEMESDEFSLCVCPGYLSDPELLDRAVRQYDSGEYNTVLAVLPVARILPVIKGADLGVIDCYSQTNQGLFAAGDLGFVTGKYSSVIGPSFAAMYNAVTGHAEDFRDNGKAFRISQGFWSSDSLEDFDEKYSMASSIEKCAYNYEDLQSVIAEYNPDAKLSDLVDLAEAYTFEDAQKRRAG